MRRFALLLVLTGFFSAALFAAEPFSVMTYNVHGYTGAGSKLSPEHRALIELISSERPDVLAVQEMGNEKAFASFRKELRETGLDYPHATLLSRGKWEVNLALLSRFPLTNVQHRTNDLYRIGSARLRVLRGFLDATVEVAPDYQFRLLCAHLKSKVYHRLGQTEMRRSEARLLSKAVREILAEDPDCNLLVLGDMNDTYRSAPVREVTGRSGGKLIDLRPVDAGGDVWTLFMSGEDRYERFDYLFVNERMLPEVIRDQTRAVRDPLIYKASDHRPLVGVFDPVDR